MAGVSLCCHPPSSSKSRKRNSQLSSMRSLRSSTYGFQLGDLWSNLRESVVWVTGKLFRSNKKQLPWNLHLRQPRFLEACFRGVKWFGSGKSTPTYSAHLSVIFVYKSCICIHTNNLYLYIAYTLHPSYNDHYITITSGNIQVYI